MLSGAVAGAAGILIAPITPLTPTRTRSVVVPALAAAVVGRFQYLIPTVIAGLGDRHAPGRGDLPRGRATPGCPSPASAELVPLVVILVALLVTGRAMPDRGGLRPPSAGPGPAAALVHSCPIVIGHARRRRRARSSPAARWRAAVIVTFIAAILALSLVVVTGYAGQVSLAQLALAGVGAFMLSYLTVELGRAVPVRTAAGRAGRRRASASSSACPRCGSAGSRSAS